MNDQIRREPEVYRQLKQVCRPALTVGSHRSVWIQQEEIVSTPQNPELEQKLEELRRLFADGPEIAKVALENAIQNMTAERIRSQRKARDESAAGKEWCRS